MSIKFNNWGPLKHHLSPGNTELNRRINPEMSVKSNV